MSTHAQKWFSQTCCAIAVVPWLYVHGVHTTHSRIHHDQTCIAVVRTRIPVVSVAVSSSSKQRKKAS